MIAKRTGRPRKMPMDGTRVGLGLRVTADTKRRLEAAADASGRSQSQEAEHRIDQSLRDDRLEVLLREILSRLPPLAA